MGRTGVSISNECHELIKKILPSGKTILEFGSGYGTVKLSEHYKMYSVENQPEWFNRFPDNTTYINCRNKYYDEVYTAPPIPENYGWYHPDDVFPNLPDHYDLILIDGPGHKPGGRAGFLKHIDQFNTSCIIVFDDVFRKIDMMHMELVAEHLGRPYHLLTIDGINEVGYIL
jgi:hypothetical protein